MNNTFLMQLVNEPTRDGSLLYLLLVNSEGLVGDVKIGEVLDKVTMRW